MEALDPAYAASFAQFLLCQLRAQCGRVLQLGEQFDEELRRIDPVHNGTCVRVRGASGMLLQCDAVPRAAASRPLPTPRRRCDLMSTDDGHVLHVARKGRQVGAVQHGLV